MEKIEHCIACVYTDSQSLQQSERELLSVALQVTQTAYAPYSHFRVGAAVRLASGKIVCGSNQENIAYPSGLCAERVALFSAFAHYPNDELRAIAIAATELTCDNFFIQTNNPITPCGACRQVLCEYAMHATKSVKVIMAGKKEIWLIEDARLLLPFAFTFSAS